MDLVEIVALDFLLEDATYVFQGGEPFESTSSHDPILEPAIRSFDFAFGLWGESIADLDRHQSHDLTPLRIDFIRLEHVLAPNTVPVLDKTKDA